MQQSRWLITFVNFYTKDLIGYQLKTLKRSSLRTAIRIVIVDNSPNSEAPDLLKMLESAGFRNQSTVIDNSSCRLVSSEAHADGLNKALALARGEEWILTQDPDFFWLVPDHLAFLEKHLAPDMVAIGTPYRRRVGFGKPDFPAAWGAAYALNRLQPEDFSILRETGGTKFPQPEYEFSQDVGWKIRDRLSAEKYLAFDQRPAFELSSLFGSHSFESSPVEYLHQNRPIAIHLFRGSFPADLAELSNLMSAGTPPAGANENWNKIKIRFARTASFISKSQFNRQLYQLFCAANRRKPRTELAVAEYLPYQYIQRLCIPYSGQREYLKNLRKTVATVYTSVILEQIANLRSRLDTGATAFKLIYDGDTTEKTANNIFRLQVNTLQRTPSDGEVSRMTELVKSSPSASEADFDEWLSAVERQIGGIDSSPNFDSFLIKLPEIAQLLRLILDLR